MNEWRQAYLHLSIEEVADWLTRTNHGQPITAFIAADSQRDPLEKEKEERQHRHSLSLSGLPPPPPLFDCLQSGVLLCELANAIQPSLALPYKAKATVGSFLARDNVERFLRAAMDWGVPRSQLFEVDDLVMRKNDRGVVNALLDVSRIVYLKFGIAPPTIVEMELEIAQIEQQQQVAAPAPPPRPVPVPPPPPVAPEEVKPKGPRYLPYIADPDDPLDVAVGGLVNRYALDLLVKRTERGQYHIDEEKGTLHRSRMCMHHAACTSLTCPLSVCRVCSAASSPRAPPRPRPSGRWLGAVRVILYPTSTGSAVSAARSETVSVFAFAEVSRCGPCRHDRCPPSIPMQCDALASLYC